MKAVAALAVLTLPTLASAQVHDGLAERYGAACRQMSAAECKISDPPTADERASLDCLFTQLDRRAGDGSAEKHVAWAEGFAATGQPPVTGFPATIADQEILVAALIACRGPRN